MKKRSRLAITNSRLLENQARVYEAFFDMRELLEDYGPTWYPRNLHEKVESIARDLVSGPIMADGCRIQKACRKNERRAHHRHIHLH